MWFIPVLVVTGAAAASLPVGCYLAWLLDGRYRAPAWLARIERRLDTGPQDWKGYSFSLLAFNTLTFAVAFGVLTLQPVLPFNPNGKEALAPTTVFHTTVSFFANNSLQHYAGEVHLSYASQLAAVVWAMFTGGATGLAAFAAVARGLRGDPHLGNFYLDCWRALAYALVPASLAVGLALMAAGIPMTFAGAADGVARGPVAALVPVKNLASVGGGFFGTNSAHPFENPSATTNVVQCLCILLFPIAGFVAFGRMLGQPRQAAVLTAVAGVLFAALLAWTIRTDALAPNPAFAGLPVETAGNLEGKELRFGPSAAATYAATTTAVSCGSVNCMHDSLNPLAGLACFAGMWLNCVFGGKGVGLFNLLVFAIVTVFLTGLMVGRTPEYFGKKVEVREMKLAMLALLCHPVLILIPLGLFAATDAGAVSVSNPGPHGFSQLAYEFSSSAAGNGSAFEGLADTFGFAANSSPAPFAVWWDIATALVILIGRYVPIVAVLALAGSLAAKPSGHVTVGTLRTDTVTFGVVLLGVVLLLGALLFLPVAVLGPVAEHFGPMPFGQ